MAKNMKLKKFEEEFEDDFDFSDPVGCDDETITEIMGDLMETSNHQMIVALELTKLAVEKSAAGAMNEEKVFAAYKQASKVVVENFPLKGVFERFN